MQPIDTIPITTLRAVRFLLTDIDDTITTAGLLPSTSLAAMEALTQAGISVVPITGRPAGWCDHIARMWPVKAVVGENGAFYFSYDRGLRKMRQVFVKDEQTRAADRRRLEQLKLNILEKVPGAGIASDQDYRVADLAIDFCEDVPPLPQRDVERIVELFRSAGAKAKISSIHVNGWFGEYDKLSMTERCLKELFGIDIRTQKDTIIFVGDSPNDAPMFAFFDHSVGVANVKDFELATPPTWITKGRDASGFKELTDTLLKTRIR